MEYSAVSTIWIMVGTVLIFFMQAGFAMLETGMTRVKNAGNIAMKNLVDYCIGSVTFWLIGFGIMYGGDGAVLGKIKGVAMESVYGGGMLPDGIPFWAFLIFQTVFAATHREANLGRTSKLYLRIHQRRLSECLKAEPFLFGWLVCTNCHRTAVCQHFEFPDKRRKILPWCIVFPKPDWRDCRGLYL